VVRDILVVI